jgi:VWFA-related protein
MAEADPPALATVFSATEIARLGSNGAPLPALFEGWGNVQAPVTGRIAAGPLPSQPWERYAGKPARLVSAALPDLQLTLAVRLAALDLPAVLVPDLMSSATFELVNLAEPRYVDDYDALTEHIRGIDAEAMERYLGALTTAGPLRRDTSPGRTTHSTARIPGGPTLTIREPADGAPALGTTTIAVELAPAPAGVTVSMTVDGRELCRLDRAPWTCTWDADGEMQEHHLRVAATLPDGRRLVASRRTRGLDINERVEVSAVQVPVIVTDGRGRFVQGLKPEAFTLLENGKRQRIDTVIDESLPLELVAAVDISASMEASMPQVRAAVKGLLGRLRPADTTTLLGFNESVFVLTERESDTALRDLAVESLVPWGGTAFYDATVRSLDLVSQKAGRRGVVVFSDGDDRHSVGRRDASLRRIEEGQVAVYTVGFGTGTSAQFRTTLTAFAEASGGRAYFPRRVEDLDAAFGSIVEELSHQYILSYVSSAPADGSWRTLQIKACEGCHVRAREGYRAPEH